jgi:hypothetical protein
MLSLQNTQNRIKNVLASYKEAFPEEYKLSCEAVLQSRQLLTDEEFGTLNVELSGAAPQRALLEWPEQLYMMMVKALDNEEVTYLTSKQGMRWFIKVVPEFSLTK